MALGVIGFQRCFAWPMRARILGGCELWGYGGQMFCGIVGPRVGAPITGTSVLGGEWRQLCAPFEGYAVLHLLKK